MKPSLVVSGNADDTIRIRRNPTKLYTFEGVGNLRPFLEVLNFLSPEETIGIARVKKQFYEACFHSEIQNPGFIKAGVLKGHTNSVRSVVVSKNKAVLIFGSWDKTIQVWSLTTQKLTQTIKFHDLVFCVAVSSRADFLVSEALDETLRVQSSFWKNYSSP